jgi:hypothetical protein
MDSVAGSEVAGGGVRGERFLSSSCRDPVVPRELMLKVEEDKEGGPSDSVSDVVSDVFSGVTTAAGDLAALVVFDISWTTLPLFQPSRVTYKSAPTRRGSFLRPLAPVLDLPVSPWGSSK